MTLDERAFFNARQRREPMWCETCCTAPPDAELCAICAHNEEVMREARERVAELEAKLATPIPMRLQCPTCGELHIDEGEFATKPHRTHECQTCGYVWRPAVVATVGVRFLFSTEKNNT